MSRSSKCLLFAALFSLIKVLPAQGQLVVNPNQTATVLANNIAGPGVTVFGETLTCPGVANGIFTVSGTLLSMSAGIVLTNGEAAATSGPEPPLTSFNDGAAGDPSFVTLGILPAGTNTYDACELAFNVIATSDTLSFNYQFGSDEYRTAVCSPYNDAFAFFISGPGIVGTPNMALVPGTTMPVEINTVNDGIPGTSGGVLSNCTSIGAGSPFTAYYLDNTGGSLLAYRGYTDKFRAFHAVTPCDTYHLKLAIVDAGNAIYDSGVFIEAASLSVNGYSFNHLDSLGATIEGIPHSIVKGCTPATFNIIAAHANTTPATITISYSGSALPGTDITPVPASIILPADSTSVSFTIAGLPTPAVGTKTITLYIQSTCGISDSIKLNVLDTPTAKILTSDTTICPGNSKTILSTGTAGLIYSWAPAGSLTGATTPDPVATPAATTTYTLSATLPGSGCPPIIRDVTINVVSTAITMLTPDTTVCSGNALTLAVSGSPTLFYSWTPATGLSSSTVQDPVATPTATTTYTVTASGADNACPTQAQVTITVGSFTAAILTPDTTICKDSFQVRVTGTAGNDYLWSPATGVNTTTLMDPIVSPTVTTIYTLTATLPGSGCPPIVRTLTVNMANIAISILTPDTTICLGDTVFLRVAGSNSYLYTWMPWSSILLANVQNPTLVPIVSTVYTVVANSPGLNCPDTQHVAVTVIPPRKLMLTPDTTICYGVNLQLLVDTSVACTYLWTPATGLSNPFIADPVASVDSITSYKLIATSIAGHCTSVDSVTINLTGSGAIHFSATDSVYCIGSGITFSAVGDISRTGIIWSFGNGDSLLLHNPAYYAYPSPGTYTVSVTSIFNGCPDTLASKVIKVYPYPQIDLGPDTAICPGSNPILLADRVNIGSPEATWLWNTGQTSSFIDATQPGIYYATVSIAGCKSTDSVIVSNNCYLDIPNVFTPNGDGINDFFFPRQLLSKGLTYFNMSIYNRWGQLIFQSNSLDGRGWDGSFNGIPQPEGVFVYVIDATFIDSEKEHKQGNITLLR